MVGGPAATAATGAWVRLVALGIAAVFLLCGVAAVAAAHSGNLLTDFLGFWSAGRLTLNGDSASAYDVARHHAVEAQIIANVRFLPFPYPPPFLLFVAPFALAPFWVGFAAWIAVGAGLYAFVARRILPLRFSFAQAAAAANFITGQNGFLTSAIFIHGTDLLARRPFLGGAILGLLCIKPQIAILLPVALLAGREWRAIGGGILSCLALLLVSLLLFGPGAYTGFLSLTGQYSHWFNSGRWPGGELPWPELASAFAVLRLLGTPQPIALVVHGAIALVAAATTARAWALKIDERVPILAAATMLVPPYLFTYDGLLLTIPLACLLRRGSRATFGAVWLCSLLPLAGYFRAVPNALPLAALLALWALHRPRSPAAEAAPRAG